MVTTNLYIPKLTSVAQAVLEKRYLMKDESGATIETPSDLFLRVAKHIASAYGGEGWYPFYDVMAQGLFMPNTPCLINAGRPHDQGQYSACFVLPVEDNMRSIGQTMTDMMMIHKSGGGTGFDFSKLRPANDFVKSTTGIASGPISFMRMYNHVTECVKQSGARRGANMAILRVDHPDILDFIKCKADTALITNFNISVGITNEFMNALRSDRAYNLYNPRNQKVTATLKARDVWELIVAQAHATGEPGLFFVDRANGLDPLAHLEDYRLCATNPCGEVPLSAYNACTLGSINLAAFYYAKGADGFIDYSKLQGVIDVAVRFLDNVLERNSYPVERIHEVTRAQRKIGLGVMGWADLLIKLGIPYQSPKALELAHNMMKFVNNKAVAASEDLARERGPFPLWKKSKWDERGDRPRRNATVTVIAPTGSISIIAGCSSGIEPLFGLCQTRRQADMVMTDLNPMLAQHAATQGWSSDVMDYVREHGTLRGAPEVSKSDAELFAIANEISAEDHVRMQAAFQTHTEDAVSKTINLPNEAEVSDVQAAYELAWETGCKGITVYRDGCRPLQTLSLGSAPKENSQTEPVEPVEVASGWSACRLHDGVVTYPVAMECPACALRKSERRRIPKTGRRRGETFTKRTAYGSVHVTINHHPDDDQPFELFAALGKGGSEVSAWAEALGRTISLMLSTSAEPRERLVDLLDQLADIGGGDSSGMGAARISSAADGIAHCLRDYLGGLDTERAGGEPESVDVCPDCNQAALAKSGGCDVCSSCGYSKC